MFGRIVKVDNRGHFAPDFCFYTVPSWRISCTGFNVLWFIKCEGF